MKIRAVLFNLALCLGSLGWAGQGGDVSSGDNFHYNGQVDFLFVVDNSSSYNKFKELAIQEFSQFIHWMTVAGVDFQIGFTTTTCGERYTDPGNNGSLFGIPSVLKPSSPDLNEHFESRLKLGGAFSGSDLEQGLCGSLRSVNGTAPGKSWIRPNALLMIFFFSDEDDYSGISPLSFVSQMNLLRPPAEDKASWLVSFYGALPGDYTPGHFIEPGLQYISVSEQSGGSQFSLFRPNSEKFGISRYKNILSLKKNSGVHP